MVFSVRPLAEYGGVACCNAMIQVLTFINEFDLVCENPYGSLPDRDIAPVDAGAAGKVHFDFISLNQHALVTV